MTQIKKMNNEQLKQIEIERNNLQKMMFESVQKIFNLT